MTLAAAQGQTQTVQVLLNHGASVKQQLVANRADVNLQDLAGATALK